MKENVGFRGWFYFRQGWTTYFAFLFAAVNTLVVTYYLAIENIPILKEFFPNFFIYFAVVISIGVPLLIGIGYIHFKKTASYKAEADIQYEANPHALRMLINTELLLELNLKLSESIIKIMNNKELSTNEIDETIQIKKKLDQFLEERNTNRKKDLEFFIKMLEKSRPDANS